MLANIFFANFPSIGPPIVRSLENNNYKRNKWLQPRIIHWPLIKLNNYYLACGNYANAKVMNRRKNDDAIMHLRYFGACMGAGMKRRKEQQKECTIQVDVLCKFDFFSLFPLLCHVFAEAVMELERLKNQHLILPCCYFRIAFSIGFSTYSPFGFCAS